MFWQNRRLLLIVACAVVLLATLAVGVYFVARAQPSASSLAFAALIPTSSPSPTSEIIASTSLPLSGKIAANVVLALSKSGSISGKVTESDRKTPIPGAELFATPCEADTQSIGFATTATDGTYTIDGLGPGCYRVTVSAAGFATSSQAQIQVSAGTVTSGIDFALLVAASLSGTVARADGSPVAGAQVYASEPGWGFGNATTGGDGTYLIEGLPATGKNYTVTVEAAGYVFVSQSEVPVKGGNLTVGVNFVLQPGGSISGKVTEVDSTMPISGTVVFAVAPEGGFGLAVTSGDGVYRIEGLPVSTHYAVTAQMGGYVTASYGDISVRGGDVTDNVDFALTPGASISGKITEEDGKTPILGANLYVVALDGSHGFATTDRDGNYSIESLPPSENYILNVEASGYASLAKYGISLTKGEKLSGIDLALHPLASTAPPTSTAAPTSTTTPTSTATPPCEEHIWVETWDLHFGYELIDEDCGKCKMHSFLEKRFVRFDFFLVSVSPITDTGGVACTYSVSVYRGDWITVTDETKCCVTCTTHSLSCKVRETRSKEERNKVSTRVKDSGTTQSGNTCQDWITYEGSTA
jgi:hypothetical protein